MRLGVFALVLAITLPALEPERRIVCAQEPADALDALIERARTGTAPPVSDLADALMRLGPTSPELWFQALEQRRAGRTVLFPEEAPELLDPVRLQDLDALTSELPAELLRRRTSQTGLAEVSVLGQIGLGILARTGGADDLPLACRLAYPHPAAVTRDYRPTGRALERVVSEVLARDSAGYATMERLYASERSVLRTYLLRGIGSMKTFRALVLLPNLLGVDHEMDAVVLSQIGNVAQSVATPLSDHTLSLIRRYMSSPDAQRRQQAAYAVGRLDDFDAVSELIELLSDSHQGVRLNAYWSLREITAMTINAEPRRWRMWFDSETSWWSQEAPALLDTIFGSTELPEVVAAINTCGAKRLFRRQLSQELIPLLRHPEPMVIRMTCSALFSLRATNAVPALTEILGHPDPEVRAQVRDTLRGLTGTQPAPGGRPAHEPPRAR